ncbi:MAG: nucleotidyltransferase family protein [Spirochaetia bacterium]
MSGFNITQAREHLRKKREKRLHDVHDRLGRALEDRERIINFIIDRYNPKRVYTWGSLENTELFGEHSDIDIAVEGLSGPLEGLHAQSEAEDMSEFSVDLVELERIHPVYAEDIRERGRLVYER